MRHLQALRPPSVTFTRARDGPSSLSAVSLLALGKHTSIDILGLFIPFQIYRRVETLFGYSAYFANATCINMRDKLLGKTACDKGYSPGER
jgi:hypothetical protein